MARAPASRSIGELTFQEISARLRAVSILCLPLGAIEQHGPHLPLNTDVIVAEGMTRRIIERWGDEFDLWQLPTLSIGLSREHDWAAGTLSLSITSFAALLRDLARDIARSLPTRNLAIVNGHGGNRGVLETLLRELASEFALNACVIHPFDLAEVENLPTRPDVHGGRSETSVMLALAPNLVRRELVARSERPADSVPVRDLIFDRGATFPWRTDDPRLASHGVIGDARAASAEFGQAVIDGVVEGARGVLARLLDNQRAMIAAAKSRR